MGVVFSKVKNQTTALNSAYKTRFEELSKNILNTNKESFYIFENKISDYDIIRKSESEHTPIRYYSTNDNYLKPMQEEFKSFCSEMLQQINNDKLKS